MSDESINSIHHQQPNATTTTASFSEINEATNLSNALKQQQTSTTVDEFTQQTLMDVNSQPLFQVNHNLLDGHPLMAHSSLPKLVIHNTLLTNPSKLLSNVSLMDTNGASSEHNNAGVLTAATSEVADDSNSPDMTDADDMLLLDRSSPLNIDFYERFAVGQMFESLDKLRNAAYEYGRKHNVALTTSKSDKTKIYLICKHGGQYRKNNKRPPVNTEKPVKPRLRRSQKTGCPCMIYARCCRNSFWIIRKSVGEHNHPIADDPRTYAMYRSLTPENLLQVHRLLREHVGVSFIVKSLKASGVTNIIAKDIENIQQDLKRRDVLDLPTASRSLGDEEYSNSTILSTTAATTSNLATMPIMAAAIKHESHLQGQMVGTDMEDVKTPMAPMTPISLSIENASATSSLAIPSSTTTDNK